MHRTRIIKIFFHLRPHTTLHIQPMSIDGAPCGGGSTDIVTSTPTMGILTTVVADLIASSVTGLREA